MGRADDEVLLSEADEEKEHEKDTSDIDDTAHLSIKKYKCTEPGCKATFHRPSRLSSHIRKHKDERPYKCNHEGCDKSYTNSSHLKRHKNSHKPIKVTYKCSECSREMSSLCSLRRHSQRVHNSDRLRCLQCNLVFRKKHCFDDHMSSHIGTSYKCDICNETYSSVRYYKRHLLRHEVRRSYPCSFPGCTELFDKWSSLRSHIAKHTFEYKCDECNKTFKSKGRLRSHRVIHNGDVITLPCPYDNCSKSYSTMNNLDQHISIKHLGRRFYCDMCNQSCTTKRSILKHIQIIHEGKHKPRSQKKIERKLRKDAGIPKKSMAIKMAGLKLPHELEKQVLKRVPEINLENKTEVTSKDLIEENEKVSLPQVDTITNFEPPSNVQFEIDVS